MIEIKTKRLSLRNITPEYKTSLISLIGNDSVARSLSNVPFPYTDSDADWWIESVESNPLSLNVFRNNELIGGVGLTEHKHDLVELGYWMGKPYWGFGYATEAAIGLLQFVSDTLTNKQVFAKVCLNNYASERVLSKLGCVKDGTDVSIDVSTKSKIACHRYVLPLTGLQCL